MTKIFYVISAIVFIGLAEVTHAATITPGPLTITYDGNDQIFSEINIEPGDKIKKDLTVTNNGRVAHNLAIATKNVSGELGSKIYISAIENENTIWTNSILELSELAGESKFITSLNPGQIKTITLEANFPTDSENDVAGKTVNFDIVYGTEESEPETASVSLFSTTGTQTPVATPTVSSSATNSPEPNGEVRGDETQNDGINPWLLAIAPAAFLASVVFLPEFLVAGGLAAIGGGATYVLGYSSAGSMNSNLFYLLLALEVIILIAMAYFMLHHDNRTSRRIKGYKHRLRIR